MISKKVFIEKCKELAKSDSKVLIPHIFKWDESYKDKEPFTCEAEQLYNFLLDNNFFAENIVKTKSAAGEFNDDELDLVEDCLFSCQKDLEDEAECGVKTDIIKDTLIKKATAIQVIRDKINK